MADPIDKQMRDAIIRTALGHPVTSTDERVQKVVRQTKAIMARGGTVDIPPEIEGPGEPEGEGPPPR